MDLILIPLACIIISLGHMLIDSCFVGTITIAYGVCEIVVVDNCDGVRRLASRRQLRRLLRRKIASWLKPLPLMVPKDPLGQSKTGARKINMTKFRIPKKVFKIIN